MATGDIQVFSAKHDPRRAVVFDGTDDYVEIDAFTAAQVLAGDTTGTFTAWVNVADNVAGDYCIIGSGDLNAVEHLHLGIKDGCIVAQCKVAATMQWDIKTTDEVFSEFEEGLWHHIALVHDGVRPYLYFDGVKQVVTDTISTDLTAWYSVLTGGDKGAIGILNMNATLTLDMDGAISDVKYWDAVLSEDEILNEYKGIPTTTNLISHWQIGVEDVFDDEGGYDGTLTNQAYIDSQYSEVTAKLKNLSVVVADDISISASGGNVYNIVRVEA